MNGNHIAGFQNAQEVINLSHILDKLEEVL